MFIFIIFYIIFNIFIIFPISNSLLKFSFTQEVARTYHTKSEIVGPFYSRAADVVYTYWQSFLSYARPVPPQETGISPQGLHITWAVSICFISFKGFIAKCISFLWQKWNLWVRSSLKCQRSFSIFPIWFIYSWSSEPFSPWRDEKGWDTIARKWGVSFPHSLWQLSIVRSTV